MTEHYDAARSVVLAKLAESRAELRAILDPPPRNSAAAEDDSMPGAHLHSGEFPRSRTMQMLLSGRGLGTLGAAAAGLIIARPTLALRLLRILPVGAIGKMVLARVIASLRG
jgi:hypothetical protein